MSPTTSPPDLVFSTTSLFVEEGASATYTVVLDKDPQMNLNVTITSSDVYLGTSDETSLTFTPADWATAQTVRVTAVEDALSTSEEYTVTFEHNCTLCGTVEVEVSMLIFDNDVCVRNCDPGYYSAFCFNGTRVCQACDAGYTCQGGCDDPVVCEPGSYAPIIGETICTSCAEGKYAEEQGATGCTSCPAGFACTLSTIRACLNGTFSPGLASDCTDCPVGKYADAASHETCAECPVAHMCPSEGTINPVACTPGFYSLGNATKCQNCPSGYACPSTGDAPMECANGAYSLTGWQYCVQCPAGEKCSHVADPPTACEAGFYSLGNATHCEPCAFGTYANASSSAKCELCPRGHECYDAAEEPLKCAAGLFAGYGSGHCEECPAGRYSSVGAHDCESCPSGFHCARPSESPVICANGTFSYQGSAACLVCPVGLTSVGDGCEDCPAGYECGQPVLRRCAEGYYSSRAKKTLSCELCPPGFECSDPAVQPVACSLGEYATWGSVACEACPSGFECADPQRPPVSCALGNFSLSSATTCAVCEPAYYAPVQQAFAIAASDCLACDAGRYATSQQSECSNCPVGYACASGELPEKCPGGRYSENGETCEVCPEGFSCSSPTLEAISRCPVGKFAMPGAQNCTGCPSGYLPNADSSGCDACAAGFYCPFEETDSIAIKVSCPPGTFSEEGARECVPCPAGYGCSNNAALYDLVNDACPLGTFSEGARDACVDCPPGISCASPSTMQRFECPAGSYSPSGEHSCLTCPAGQYCPTPTVLEPLPCPFGTYSLSNATLCEVCEPGYSCPDGGMERLPCGIGTFSIGGASDCSPCEPGYRCGNFSTSPTPAGSECRAGTWCNPSTDLSFCPPGTYGNTTGGTSEGEACFPCDSGYFCEDSGNTLMTMQQCPIGAYCPRGSPIPQACPDGFYGIKLKASAPAECELCPAGYACSWELCPTTNFNVSVLQECQEGHFCPAGSTNSSSKECPAGSYSGTRQLTTAAQCTNCSVGYYCPPASVEMIPCPEATYNPLMSASDIAACRPCEAGYACPDTAMWRMTTMCTPGYFCPPGTQWPGTYGCPAGRFSDERNLVRSSECAECPAGYGCTGFSTSTANIADCVAGHYCPQGTDSGTAYNCPGGRYSPKQNLEAATDCYECDAGYYCTGGAAVVTGNCPQGSYCPNGTETGLDCPAGRYGASDLLKRAEQCTICPEGDYCPAGSSVSVPCPAGSFSAFTGNQAVGPSITYQEDDASCVECYAGFYCAEGSVAPQECGKGRHSASGASFCEECDRGHYCGSNTTASSLMYSMGGDWASSVDLAGRCFNGTYCDLGNDKAPDLVRNACPAGHYCPTAIDYPVPCPAGTFNTATGQDSVSDCETTPQGFYTQFGSPNVTLQCAPGHYCPAGSVGPTQVPCPERYYISNYGGGRLGACALCTAGGYCPEASPLPQTCPRGFYCSTGVSRPEPCTPGTFGNGTGLRRNEDCANCPAGSYCDGFGLEAPRGECDPGYYCSEKSYTSAPHAPGSTLTQQFEISAIGGLCPAGGFCPRGSTEPQPCPNGTFNNYTGATSSNDCARCDPGYYCAGSANPSPSGPCDPGYYCLAGSSSRTQYAVPPGYFSISGATAPTPCRPGTYQPFPGQASCLSCQAGRYCNKFNATAQLNCPIGFYCIEGTSYPEKCPAGTYGETNKLEATINCTKCEAGFYCDEVGATASTQKVCAAGFWCGQGSSRERPVAQTNAEGVANGGICPEGHYCPEGGPLNPVACPNGTYSPGEGSTGNSTDFACEPCKPGWACNATGLAQPPAKCDPGYFCAMGAIKSNPWYGGISDSCSEANWRLCDYGPCPAGYGCPEETGEPKLCAEGTYSNATYLKECEDCTPGFYCDGNKTTTLLECPQGHYCPKRTGTAQPTCPPGRFGEWKNLTQEGDCTLCPAGEFCSIDGLLAPNGLCIPGYYCPKGALNGRGIVYNDTQTTERDCPAGYYCPEGAPGPFACPNGTFSGSLNLENATQCLNCTAGMYCPAGSSAPAGLCAAGYYCERGSFGSQGSIPCPPGTFCTNGSALPAPCPAGSFSRDYRSAYCDECPPGYFCEAGDSEPQICPRGFYCSSGTRKAYENPCPQGTFSNETGRVDKSECVLVVDGFYSQGPGSAYNDGPCAAGYYCNNNSATDRPTDPYYGGSCGPGDSCPAGTALRRDCPAGMYCLDGSTEFDGPCKEGYYCTTKSSTPAPKNIFYNGHLIADVCPAGHYCPTASVKPTPCPPGTFSTAQGNPNLLFCAPCLGGYLCPDNATAALTDDMRCAAGSYCPNGTIDNPLPCPAGTFCSVGSGLPIACLAGTYQSARNSSNCTVCPAGAYCDYGSLIPEECPSGFYCPEATYFAQQFHCPRGSYSNRTGLSREDHCTPCAFGHYCESSALTEPTGLCAEGFYCTNGSKTATPRSAFDFLIYHNTR